MDYELRDARDVFIRTHYKRRDVFTRTRSRERLVRTNLASAQQRDGRRFVSTDGVTPGASRYSFAPHDWRTMSSQ